MKNRTKIMVSNSERFPRKVKSKSHNNKELIDKKIFIKQILH